MEFAVLHDTFMLSASLVHLNNPFFPNHFFFSLLLSGFVTGCLSNGVGNVVELSKLSDSQKKQALKEQMKSVYQRKGSRMWKRTTDC